MKRTRGLTLGTINGVPLTLTAGWAIIAVVMMVVFAPIVQTRLDLPPVGSYVVALGVPLLLAVSVLIHEVAHGVSAQWLGYRVREYVITLWGGHTTFTSEIDRPGASAVVAGVGPASNLVLAAIGWVVAPSLGPVGSFLALTLTYTNAFVGIFNLLPASPLDGGKLLEAAIWKVSGDRWLGMRIAGRIGQVTAVAVIAAFAAWPYMTGNRSTLTVITGAIVGSVIWQGAGQTVRAASARSAARDFTLAPYLSPVTLISATTMVDQIPSSPAVVVDPSGHPLGLVDPAALAAVPPAYRQSTPASAVQVSARAAVITTLAGSAAIAQVAQGLTDGAQIFLTDPAAGTGVMVIDIKGVLAELKARGA